ncbi:hypothetical protein HDE_12309 [Halotydeus destructor]|nr:hypothetical protein HDE_12309 [Halotydeus destructor]
MTSWPNYRPLDYPKRVTDQEGKDWTTFLVTFLPQPRDLQRGSITVNGVLRHVDRQVIIVVYAPIELTIPSGPDYPGPIVVEPLVQKYIISLEPLAEVASDTCTVIEPATGGPKFLFWPPVSGYDVRTVKCHDVPRASSRHCVRTEPMVGSRSHLTYNRSARVMSLSRFLRRRASLAAREAVLARHPELMFKNSGVDSGYLSDSEEVSSPWPEFERTFTQADTEGDLSKLAMANLRKRHHDQVGHMADEDMGCLSANSSESAVKLVRTDDEQDQPSS